MCHKLLGWDYNLLVLKNCFHVVDCKWHVESLVSAMDCALMSLSKARPLACNNLLISLSYSMDYAGMSLSRVCPGQCDRLCLLKPVQSLTRHLIVCKWSMLWPSQLSIAPSPLPPSAWHVYQLVSAMDCALMSLSKARPFIAANACVVSAMDCAFFSLSRACPDPVQLEA